MAYKRRLSILIMSLLMAGQTFAQQNKSPYTVDSERVYYHHEPMMRADARSFVILGHGYAKDRSGVYYKGKLLPWVDPQSFRLYRNHERYADIEEDDREGYYKIGKVIFFDGEKVAEDFGNSFKDLGDGYAKTTFDVYFMGKKMSSLMASNFKVLGGGYACDNFDVFYMGKKIPGVMASSFVYDGKGYGHDSFDTYYRGKKVK